MGCDDIWLAIKAPRVSADADAREIAAHLEGLNKTKSAMKPGERRLASDWIEPKHTSFDLDLHEVVQMQQTDKIKPE